MKIQIQGEKRRIDYCSGQTYYSECFGDGRLYTGYWNACGQEYGPPIPGGYVKGSETFSLRLGNEELQGKLRLLDMIKSGEDHAVILLEHESLPVSLEVHTLIPDDGFLVRYLKLRNNGDEPLAITEAECFAGMLWGHRTEEHLARGMESPFQVAYTHRSAWCEEGDFYYSPLEFGKFDFSGGLNGRSGWGRPAFWAHNLCNGQTFVCELAWGGNWHFAFDCRNEITGNAIEGMFAPPVIRSQAELCCRIGPVGVNGVLRVLDPHEELELPAVHFGMFHASTDRIVQATHRHVREQIVPHSPVGSICELEKAHRGYLCEHENVADILEDIELAAEMGLEIYVIDAGWAGIGRGKWYNGAGDWSEGEWMADGGGLRAIARKVKEKGMKLGLWLEIEAAGCESKLFQEHPEWFLKYAGIYPVGCGGRALDLTNPEVYSFALQTISFWIQELDLGMFRLDHNHLLKPSPNRNYQGFREDLVWRYYEAFYRLFEELRRKFPRVIFQNCATGGGRLDWKTISLFHNSELTDCTIEPRSYKILNGVTMSIPPEFLLSRVGVRPRELDGNIFSDTARAFSRMIIRGLAKTEATFGEYSREQYTKAIRLHQEIYRRVLENGLTYHHTPFLPVIGDAPWCVMENAAPDRKLAVAVLMRCRENQDDVYAFFPRGIDPAKNYRVELLNEGICFTISGGELRLHGIRIRIETALDAEVVVMNAVS